VIGHGHDLHAAWFISAVCSQRGDQAGAVDGDVIVKPTMARVDRRGGNQADGISAECSGNRAQSLVGAEVRRNSKRFMSAFRIGQDGVELMAWRQHEQACMRLL